MLTPISSNNFSIPSPPIISAFSSSANSLNQASSPSSQLTAFFFGEALGAGAAGGASGVGSIGREAARAALLFDLDLAGAVARECTKGQGQLRAGFARAHDDASTPLGLGEGIAGLPLSDAL